MAFRSILSAAAGLLAAACAADAGEADFPAVRATVEAACEAGTFSGVVMIRQGSEAPLTVVCGEGVDRDSLFRIFSTSKQFTAAVIMTHVEAGRLDLEAPITRHLPSAPESWASVRVRDLLQHTSGLPDLTGELLDAYRQGRREHPQAMRQVLESSTDIRPEPDTGYRYNNFGYELLTLVAEAVHPTAFEAQAAAFIFDRAGLESARFELADPSTQVLAAANTSDLTPGYNGQPSDMTRADSLSFVQRGAGALHMSAPDMLAYIAAYRAAEIVNDASMAAMTAGDVAGRPGVQVGYGWFIRNRGGEPFISHSGGTNGYISIMGYAPVSDVEIAIASNYGFTDLRPILDAALGEAD